MKRVFSHSIYHGRTREDVSAFATACVNSYTEKHLLLVQVDAGLCNQIAAVPDCTTVTPWQKSALYEIPQFQGLRERLRHWLNDLNLSNGRISNGHLPRTLRLSKRSICRCDTRNPRKGIWGRTPCFQLRYDPSIERKQLPQHARSAPLACCFAEASRDESYGCEVTGSAAENSPEN